MRHRPVQDQVFVTVSPHQVRTKSGESEVVVVEADFDTMVLDDSRTPRSGHMVPSIGADMIVAA